MLEENSLVRFAQMRQQAEFVKRLAHALMSTGQATGQATDEVNVEFIRLLFRSRIEEEIAYRWASRLGRLIGPRIMNLRPDTTLSELLKWAATGGVDSIRFVLVFEPELRMDLALFLDYSDHATFREMVEHYAAKLRGCS
jgi:hypothetical protein